MASIRELHNQLVQKQRSAVEITQEALDRIQAVEPKLHSFLHVTAEQAIEQAKQVDAKLAAGEEIGLLAGIPIGIKDNMCTQGVPTTCASRILEHFVPPYESTVTARLAEAGAVMVGKTNLDEFAMGGSTENSAFQLTANPWDLERIPGGSSGGSAAAVAAGECVVSLGSDTGGSIRQPAALCGVVGMKPTYGLVSRYGLVAFASSLDQIGPFGFTVSDVALMMNVISGHDAKDSTSVRREPVDYLAKIEEPLKGLRLGVVREYDLESGIDGDVKSAVNGAIEKYKELGATIVDVSLPTTPYGIAAYYVIAPCEASSNLARYDGVHFGHRTKEPINDIIELFSKSRAEGFGEEVQRRIMIGTYALSSGYYDAYYNRALKLRTLIRKDFDEAFGKCDAIICPTSPIPAFKIGEKSGDPLQMYLCDVFTVTCNIAGIAGLSLPCGFTNDAKPLPIGLQLLGPNFSEEKLLRIGRMYERVTAWSGLRAGG